MRLRHFVTMLAFAVTTGAAAAAPTIMRWNVDGQPREALVFAPEQRTPQEAHPLVFAFHGHGGNMEGFSRAAAIQQYWPEAIVVVPQGLPTTSHLDPHGKKPGWQRFAGDDGDRDLKLFDAMLATLRQRYRIDDRRVFATGFSNGAFFSLLLWIERGREVAGVAIVAGALDPSQHLPAAKPVLHVAGEHDPLVTPQKVEPTIAEERRADGTDGPGRACGNGCTDYLGKAPVRVVWHPGGHVYPPRAAELTAEFFRNVNATQGEAPPRRSAADPPPADGDAPRAETIHYDSHGLSSRIVVAGGSFGGIQTLLTAERDGRERLGMKCFVAMAPAAQSWENPNWAGRLTTAIEAARAPIFLAQARNDYSLGPSEVLGPRVDAKGPPSRHTVFPAHGDPGNPAQGHGGFFSDPQAWGDAVLAFLHDCGEA
jgi:polyhydroxybutyrate depolymerase